MVIDEFINVKITVLSVFVDYLKIFEEQWQRTLTLSEKKYFSVTLISKTKAASFKYINEYNESFPFHLNKQSSSTKRPAEESELDSTVNPVKKRASSLQIFFLGKKMEETRITKRKETSHSRYIRKYIFSFYLIIL